MDKKQFFETTLKLFEEYRKKMKDEKPKGYNSNLSNEVHMRLRQLNFICEKIDRYQQIVLKPELFNKDFHKQTKFFDEGSFFAEAFYFFAWRIIQITQDKEKPLPGLKGLKSKSKGIVLVRNCLIQHPERTKEKLFTISYGWGNNGPNLKNARPVGQTFEIKDEGLWINAQEFKDSFEELLKRALT